MNMLINKMTPTPYFDPHPRRTLGAGVCDACEDAQDHHAGQGKDRQPDTGYGSDGRSKHGKEEID